MLRFLALALLVLLIWMALSALLERVRRAAGGGTGPSRGRSAPVSRAPGEPLVRCESCGVRIPASRVLPGTAAGVYCSEECRRRAAEPESR